MFCTVASYATVLYVLCLHADSESQVLSYFMGDMTLFCLRAPSGMKAGSPRGTLWRWDLRYAGTVPALATAHTQHSCPCQQIEPTQRESVSGGPSGDTVLQYGRG